MFYLKLKKILLYAVGKCYFYVCSDKYALGGSTKAETKLNRRMLC